MWELWLAFMALGHDLQPLLPYHLLARVSLYIDVVDFSLIFNHPFPFVSPTEGFNTSVGWQAFSLCDAGELEMSPDSFSSKAVFCIIVQLCGHAG